MGGTKDHHNKNGKVLMQHSPIKHEAGHFTKRKQSIRGKWAEFRTINIIKLNITMKVYSLILYSKNCISGCCPKTVNIQKIGFDLNFLLSATKHGVFSMAQNHRHRVLPDINF